MPQWFHRIFAPELADERRRREFAEFQLEQRTIERDAAVTSLGKTQGKLEAEIRAARKREDHLNGEIVRLAGGRPAPERETLVSERSAVSSEQSEISSEDTETLYQRAKDYAEQTEGSGYSDAKLQEIYANMKQSPEYWLSNV